MKIIRLATCLLNCSSDSPELQTRPISTVSPWAGALLLIASVLISACAEDPASSGPSTLTGRFIDSAVEGVTYTTATQTGTTDSNGNFTYLAGEVVSFYIGDILIGSAVGQALLTPIEFVPGAIDETDPQVTNILRFVQSLDSDSDPSNGITISSTVVMAALGQSLDFSNTVNFDTVANALLSFLTSGAVTALVDAGTAQAHFIGSLGGGSPAGTLTLSGADTSLFGTSFTADPLLTMTSPFSIQWHQDFLDSSFIDVAVILNGVEIYDVLFTWQSGLDAAAYAISCTTTNPGGFYPPGDCSQMVLDTTANQVTFNVDIDEFPLIGPSATMPINVTGVLDF